MRARPECMQLSHCWSATIIHSGQRCRACVKWMGTRWVQKLALGERKLSDGTKTQHGRVHEQGCVARVLTACNRERSKCSWRCNMRLCRQPILFFVDFSWAKDWRAGAKIRLLRCVPTRYYHTSQAETPASASSETPVTTCASLQWPLASS